MRDPLPDADRRPLLIGIGNAWRGDDAAGLEVARLLDGAPGVDVRACTGSPLAVLDLLDGAPAAVLVDAVRSADPPGTIVRLDACAGPLPAQSAGTGSTHAAGLAEAIELARTLGRLPRRTVVVGVSAASFELGAPLSPPVAAALPRAAAAALAEARRPPRIARG